MRTRLHEWARSGLLAITTALLLALAGGGVARAEGYAYDLAGELMSPFCPGRTLASCPSPQAAELIQWISLQEAAGASEDEVVEILIERFGEEILGAPPAEGITLWAYVFPVAGFVLGGGVVVFALRRLVRRRGEAGDSTGEETGASARSTSTSAKTSASASEGELARLVDAELARRGRA